MQYIHGVSVSGPHPPIQHVHADEAIKSQQDVPARSSKDGFTQVVQILIDMFFP